MELIISLLSLITFFSAYFLGKLVFFYSEYYKYFTDEFYSEFSSNMTPHPEMFDNNGNLIRDDLLVMEIDPDFYDEYLDEDDFDDNDDGVPIIN